MNLKSTLFLVALSCFCAIPTKAQIDFDLADFKSPEVKYQGLDASLFLSGQNSSENANNHFGSGYLDFFRYQNTDRYVGRHQVDLSLAMSRNTIEPSNIYTRYQDRSNFQARIGASSQNNLYWNERSGFFTQLDGYWSNSYSRSVEEQREENGDPRFDEKDWGYNHMAHARAGVGYGRVEPVRFARLAYDTYQMLAKKGLIETATPEQIEELANVMVDITNTRFFDSRFKTIFQLEQIDSTLRVQGLAGDMPLAYFAQLADVWNSANSFQRGSGNEISAGIKTVYDYSRSESRDLITETNYSYSGADYGGLLAYVEYRNEKPLNIKWQRYWGASLEYGDVDDRYPETGAEGILSANYGYGWYPNTRTSMNLELAASAIQGYRVESLPPSDVEYDQYVYSTQLNGSLYYWFTARFRLRAMLSVGFSDDLAPDPGPQRSLQYMWWASSNSNYPFRWRGDLALSYALF